VSDGFPEPSLSTDVNEKGQRRGTAWPMEVWVPEGRCHQRRRMLGETGEGVDKSTETGLGRVLAVPLIIISSFRSPESRTNSRVC